MARSGGHAVFYFALALFALFWLAVSQTAPVLGEGVAVYPAPAARQLAEPSTEGEAPSFAPTCADPGPIRTVASDQIRPRVSVCVGDRQYPLQIVSYANGIPYWITDLLWPLHRGIVFRVRAFGLLLGLLSILFTHRLVARFADSTSADVAALFIATTPGFVWLHSSLLHHELLPWVSCAAALDQLTRCRALRPGAPAGEEAPPTGRLLAAAALVGLAMLSNAKSIFLILPLAVMALRARVRLGAIRPSQWLAAAVVFVAVLSPMLLGNAANAGSDLIQELMARSRMFVSQLDPMKFLAELPNLVVFWGDALVFGALASGERPAFAIPGMIAVVPPLVYSMCCGLAFLWRGRGALVPAALGLLVLCHVLVSAFLYNYYVGANYMTLGAVLGAAAGVTAVDGGRWIASRLGRPATGAVRAVVGVMLAALIWSVVGRGFPAHFVTMSMNGVAVRALGAYLDEHPDPDVPIFVTTYVLAGVPEAVTGGSIRTIKASDYLACSSARNVSPGLEDDALESGRRCVRRRFDGLLAAFPDTMRLLLPVKMTPVDDPLAGEYAGALEGAAAAAGRRLVEEKSFSGWDTGPLLRLVRVEGAATRPLDRAR